MQPGWLSAMLLRRVTPPGPRRHAQRQRQRRRQHKEQWRHDVAAAVGPHCAEKDRLDTTVAGCTYLHSRQPHREPDALVWPEHRRQPIRARSRQPRMGMRAIAARVAQCDTIEKGYSTRAELVATGAWCPPGLHPLFSPSPPATNTLAPCTHAHTQAYPHTHQYAVCCQHVDSFTPSTHVRHSCKMTQSGSWLRKLSGWVGSGAKRRNRARV